MIDNTHIFVTKQELQALAFEMVATRKDAPAAAEILSEFIHMLTSMFTVLFLQELLVVKLKSL